MRRLFDRWRLTLVGCPSLGVVAYIATGRISYTVLVVLGSAFALGLCDTFVTSFLGAFVFLVLSGLLATEGRCRSAAQNPADCAPPDHHH